MSEELLRHLAWLCGDDVPASYLSLLAHYPPQLLAAVRSDDNPDDDRCVADVELLARLADVIAINEEARAISLLNPDGEEFFWPEQLLIIGETGSGDYYCLDVTGECPGVLQYRHQPMEFEVIADTLEEFVELVLSAFGESSAVEN